MARLSAVARYCRGAAVFLVLAAARPAAARPHWTLADPGTSEPAGMFLPANIFFIDTHHGVLVGRVPVPRKGVRPGIVWTRDGGRIWHRARIKADLKNTNLAGLWFSDAHLGWADGTLPGGGPGRCVLLKTADGGRSWRQVALPRSIANVNRVWFGPGGKHGRLMPYAGTFFWQTTNGGRNWKQINVGWPFLGGAWIDSWRHIVLAGLGGTVLLSTDAGQRWTLVRTGLKGPAARLAAISFARGGQVGWAVGGQGKWARNGGFWMPIGPVILHTADGGRTWSRQTPPQGRSGSLATVWAISPSQAWIGSVLGYAWANPMTALPWLLHTADGGRTWPDVLHHLVSIHKLFFLDARHGWAVAGGGGGSPYEPNGMVAIYRDR